MNHNLLISTLAGAMIAMTQPASAAPEASTDPRIDPQIRSFLDELNRNPAPFWEKPGPEVRAVLTGLQQKTTVDLSGVQITQKTISENGRSVKLYIVTPEKSPGIHPVILFIHGGVWIAGNFENHQRLVRDLVVGTGAVVVFPEYTPIPDAVYPTQIEEIYAAAKWVAAHGAEIGVDGTRMAVAGNSVGGNMSAVLTMMAKDRRTDDPLSGAADSRDRYELRDRILSQLRHRPIPAACVHAVRLEYLRT
jgi:acetyl esterase